MKKKTIINHKMKESGNTEARPEQIKFNKIIRSIFYDCEVRMEYPVLSDNIMVAKLDVAVVTKRIGYRLMGESHTPDDPDDKAQKERLEKMGWIIHDVWWDLNPELWVIK